MSSPKQFEIHSENVFANKTNAYILNSQKDSDIPNDNKYLSNNEHNLPATVASLSETADYLVNNLN